MPRFHLHVYDTFTAFDEEGIDLPDLKAAYASAVAGMRSILSERVSKGHLATNLRIRITDSEGAEIAVVTFDDAVDMPLRS
jgi:hypothetical protein